MRGINGSHSMERLNGFVWPASLNPPVNKGRLSTRETGESASENTGFDLNPGVAPAAPLGPLFQPERVGGTQNPCAMLRIPASEQSGAAVKKTTARSWAEGRWLPDMNSNRGSRVLSGLHHLLLRALFRIVGSYFLGPANRAAFDSRRQSGLSDSEPSPAARTCRILPAQFF